jgi:hypothetical protein
MHVSAAPLDSLGSPRPLCRQILQLGDDAVHKAQANGFSDGGPLALAQLVGVISVDAVQAGFPLRPCASRKPLLATLIP